MKEKIAKGAVSFFKKLLLLKQNMLHFVLATVSAPTKG